MITFKNLRINIDKVAVNLDLLGLQKINIICGKNNSGKSTILNAIAGKFEALIGLQLNLTELENIEIKEAEYIEVETEYGIDMVS
jgi:AAA15 family ATPase/GTPase